MGPVVKLLTVRLALFIAAAAALALLPIRLDPLLHLAVALLLSMLLSVALLRRTRTEVGEHLTRAVERRRIRTAHPSGNHGNRPI